MLNYFGKNSTVSDILSAVVLGVYALWHLQCSISGPMYQPYSQFGAHNARSFGLLLFTTRVPGGANGVQLKLNSPNMWVYTDRGGSVLDCLIIFMLIFACCNILSHICS